MLAGPERAAWQIGAPVSARRGVDRIRTFTKCVNALAGLLTLGHVHNRGMCIVQRQCMVLNIYTNNVIYYILILTPTTST